MAEAPQNPIAEARAELTAAAAIELAIEAVLGQVTGRLERSVGSL